MKRTGRKYWEMQYEDPETGSKVRKSTKTANRREADRMAGQWKKELRDGNDSRCGRMLWEDFRQRYEEEHVASLADDTAKKVDGVLNVFDRTINPKRIGDVTERSISRYQAKLAGERSQRGYDSQPSGPFKGDAELGRAIKVSEFCSVDPHASPREEDR